MIMNKGRITQVMGPVVDVVFEDGELPFINLSKMRLKSRITVKNASWKLPSTLETTRCAV